MTCRLAVAALAVIVLMTEALLVAQLPDQPEHRWEVTHRAKLANERVGVLELVSGRLVFTESPPFGLWTWVLPLRELRAVKADGGWVAIELRRVQSLTDIATRFRPRQGSAEQLAAEIRRLAGDTSILAAGDGLANIRGVMDPRTSILVTTLDGTPIWTKEPPLAPRLRRAASGPGFRLVGADVEVAPGPHRLSMAVLGFTADASCTLEFHARPGRFYTLSKGARSVPVLKDTTTGESSPGRCIEDGPADKVLSTLTQGDRKVVLHGVDGWPPWVTLGERRLRNPDTGPAGSRWIKEELRIPAGPHVVAVGYFEKGFDTKQSIGDCPLKFTAESGRRYQLRADLTGRIKGTSFYSWRVWVLEDSRRTVAERHCGSD